LSPGILNECNPRGAIWIVLNSDHLSGFIVTVSLEVYEAISPLSTSTDVTSRNASGVIPATTAA
jgi:hypothetical protein